VPSFLLGLWASLGAIAFLLAGVLIAGFLSFALTLGIMSTSRVIWVRWGRTRR
jgi:hypothetical protein